MGVTIYMQWYLNQKYHTLALTRFLKSFAVECKLSEYLPQASKLLSLGQILR